MQLSKRKKETALTQPGPGVMIYVDGLRIRIE